MNILCGSQLVSLCDVDVGWGDLGHHSQLPVLSCFLLQVPKRKWCKASTAATSTHGVPELRGNMAAAQGAGSGSAGPSGAPGSAPAHSSNSAAVAVWEWQDEFGRWRPYRGSVCSYIEQVIQASQQKGRRSGSGLLSSIPLGHADPALAPYVIDIPSLTQFRQDTGKGAAPAALLMCLGINRALFCVEEPCKALLFATCWAELCEHICSPDAVCCPLWKNLQLGAGRQP